MPVNDLKVLSIIKDSSSEVEERFEGYKDELLNTMADILLLERQHMVSATQIVKKIGDKCDALGKLVIANDGNVQ